MADNNDALVAALNTKVDMKAPPVKPTIILPTGGKIVSKAPREPVMKLTREEAIAALAKIRETYLETTNITQYTALIMGIYSSGKTHILGTGRKPIIINSFDPTGTLVLRKLAKSGGVLIRKYWNEDRNNPTEYKRWETQWETDIQNGLLSPEFVGTYCLDSFTTFIAALVNWWSRNNTNKLPYLNDFPGIYALIQDVIKRTASLGIDLIVTGHLEIDTDDVSGKKTAMLATYNKLRTELPLLFTEKLVANADGYKEQVAYQLLTAPQGKFHAGTQLGADGLLDPIEQPDIKHILKKVGMPYDDKEIYKDVVEYINKTGGGNA